MLRLCVILVVLVGSATAYAQQTSPILYLNRCKGNCRVEGGNIDDARAMKSSVPAAGMWVVEEFKNSAGQTGAAADAEWNAIVQCLREIYSPYNVTVLDTVPPGGQSHNQGIIAGRYQNIGYTPVGGVSPGTRCGAADNVISFTFANGYGGTGMGRVYDICHTAAQETAHAWGLDHSYELSDGRPACMDPMTYQPTCGRQFFRNDESFCGEYEERPCQCGARQNSHRQLTSIFGKGTPLTTPPVLTWTQQPANGSTIGDGYALGLRASAQRGVARLDLWVNDYKWATVKGAPFGSNGQVESTYTIVLPNDLPDGILDIVIKVYDDIEEETSTQLITVTKDAPCATAATCAKGQVCGAGKCYWEPPVGELGDACEFPQYCLSGQCVETTDGSVCSDSCIVVMDHGCGEGFDCIGVSGSVGYCLATPEAGCCSVGGDRRAALMLSLVVLGLVLRRRRPNLGARSASS
jgi:hypothetical protein